MPLKPGDTLLNSQYQILGLLGRGGYGFVYRARDTHLDEDVAIKELLPGLIGDDEVRRRFLAEAKATLRLRHDRIVGTRHVFPEREADYIVMDYMPGGSLEVRLRQGPLSVDDSVRIAAEVCDALAYAHSHGVVHCDLKPANILFTADPLPGTGGSARLADFGIAHVSDPSMSRSWATSTGFAAGTLPYMSPEQLDGVRDDPRLDLYALGAVLYRMLTGRPYLDFDTSETPRAQMENLQRICDRQPQPPSTHRPEVPHWLDAVVLRALAKRPADRFPSAEAFRAALLQPDRVPVPLLRTVPPEPPTTGHRRKATPLRAWPWLAAGAAVLLVLLGIALASILHGRGTASTPTLTPTATSTPPPPPATPLGEGERIAFASDRDGNWEIYTVPAPGPPAQVNADGSGQRRLTNNSVEDRWPSWSPDGARIAFDSYRDGNGDIYVMPAPELQAEVNADSSGQTRLTDNPATDWVRSWSPDGARIAFTSYPDGNGDIYLVNADGSGQTRLTNEPAEDVAPSWSPDGQRIAFASHRDGNWEIYVLPAPEPQEQVNADGSGQTNLTNAPDDDEAPAWSPDGARIAFHSYRDGNWDIYVMNADGSGQTRLTNHPAEDAFPSWSPDGARIAFDSNRDGNWEIYVMNADGSGQTNLSNNPAGDWDPAWSP